jgi:hypothetical protein
MIFKPTQREKAHEFLDDIFNLDKNAKIEKSRKLRSLNQNNYLHGVVFSTFAIEMGWTLAEAKQYFKNKFLQYEKDGQIFVKETSGLDTLGLEKFAESCRVHASKDHACYIPLPNEVTQELINEIEKYSKYIK